jgi:hypothetical protein
MEWQYLNKWSFNRPETSGEHNSAPGPATLECGVQRARCVQNTQQMEGRSPGPGGADQHDAPEPVLPSGPNVPEAKEGISLNEINRIYSCTLMCIFKNDFDF